MQSASCPWPADDRADAPGAHFEVHILRVLRPYVVLRLVHGLALSERDAEVYELDEAVLRQEDIAGLDIAVRDAPGLAVEERDAAGDLVHERFGDYDE